MPDDPLGSLIDRIVCALWVFRHAIQRFAHARRRTASEAMRRRESVARYERMIRELKSRTQDEREEA